jgi:hypothetical protein
LFWLKILCQFGVTDPVPGWKNANPGFGIREGKIQIRHKAQGYLTLEITITFCFCGFSTVADPGCFSRIMNIKSKIKKT